MAGLTVFNAVLAALCITGTSAWPSLKRQTLTLQSVQQQALENAYKVLNGTLDDGLTNRVATCNKDTVAVRKE
jgi:tyrosinase